MAREVSSNSDRAAYLKVRARFNRRHATCIGLVVAGLLVPLITRVGYPAGLGLTIIFLVLAGFFFQADGAALRFEANRVTWRSLFGRRLEWPLDGTQGLREPFSEGDALSAGPLDVWLLAEQATQDDPVLQLRPVLYTRVPAWSGFLLEQVRVGRLHAEDGARRRLEAMAAGDPGVARGGWRERVPGLALTLLLFTAAGLALWWLGARPHGT